MEGNWTNAPAVVFKADKLVYLTTSRAWFNSLKLPIGTRDESVLPPSGQHVVHREKPSLLIILLLYILKSHPVLLKLLLLQLQQTSFSSS